MRRVALTTVAALAAAALSVLPGGPPASAQPTPAARQSLVVEPLGGHDIYTHTTTSDYRIGPALMRSTGSTVYRYTCGPAPTGPGEVIRMATSFNGGSTWSSETVVLQPSTSGPEDVLGVCDPAIVKVDQDYFYLAYTGVASDGTRRLFVARAINPGGPFTKWNGTGWTGGVPAPLIDRDALAAGPSLVNRAGTLHLFYNTRITTGPAAGTYQTRHATATLGTNPGSWPARLTADPGVAIGHPGKYTGTDCVGSHWWADTDVKYDETTNKFLAITTDQSTYRWSALQAYESADDGSTFTRAIITRGDYQQGARNPGQLADPYGHLTPNAPKAIGYAHSATCGQADLRYTVTQQNNLTTGAIVEPLLASAADWQPDSGTWSIASGGYYAQTQATTGQVYETTLATGTAAASSTISVYVRGSGTQSKRVGLHFAKAHPGDTTDQSGYTAYLEAASPDNGNQARLCLYKAGFGSLGCKVVYGLAWTSWNQLTIIQSGSAIKAYLNGDPAGGLSVTDADHPYLGGYLGLITYDGTGDFRFLAVGDNMPTWGTQDDWVSRAGDGDWDFVGDGYISNDSIYGQINLRTITTAGITRDVQLGDGTYTASISTLFSDDDEWGGLALTNDGITRSWSTGGYVVFLRGNGNLGVYKAGTGQVVADVPTGSIPWRHALRVRVVKTGPNFQVYFEDLPDPLINWTDTSTSAWGIGGFGVANEYTELFLDELTYAGNDAH